MPASKRLFPSTCSWIWFLQHKPILVLVRFTLQEASLLWVWYLKSAGSYAPDGALPGPDLVYMEHNRCKVVFTHQASTKDLENMLCQLD